MRKRANILLLSMLVLLSSAALAFPQGWSASKEIQLSGNHTYKALFLDPDIYRLANDDLSDIRIADKNNDFVPYYLQQGSGETAVTETLYAASRVNSYTKNKDTYHDYEILPQQPNTDIIGNALLVSLPDREFLKHVDLYGSYDGLRWDYLLNDSVYRVRGLSKDKIAFPGSQKYTHYRLVILDNLEEIQLTDIRLLYSTSQLKHQDYQRTVQLPRSITHQNKTTVITLNNQNREKVVSLHFAIDGNFQRRFNLSANERLITSSELYQLTFQGTNITGTTLTLPEPINAEEIILIIHNRDDRPLAIQGITATTQVDKLVFEDSGNQPYIMYFNNPEAARPVYELELFRKHVEQEPQDILSLGQLIELRQDPPPKPPRLDYLFNTLIAAISLLLIFWLARQLARGQV